MTKNKNTNFKKKTIKLEVVVASYAPPFDEYRKEEIPNKGGEFKAPTCKQ
jgi:hypothetical protein